MKIKKEYYDLCLEGEPDQLDYGSEIMFRIFKSIVETVLIVSGNGITVSSIIL